MFKTILIRPRKEQSTLDCYLPVSWEETDSGELRVVMHVNVLENGAQKNLGIIKLSLSETLPLAGKLRTAYEAAVAHSAGKAPTKGPSAAVESAPAGERLLVEGAYAYDTVSGHTIGADWRCPIGACRSLLAWIDPDGTCMCVKGHGSR